METKQYRKLSAAQFRDLADALPMFLAMAGELKEAMRTVQDAKWQEVLGTHGGWAWAYELPFIVHISTCIYALNLRDWLTEVVTSPDPQQRVIDDMRNDASPLSEDFHPDFDNGLGFGLLVSLIRTMQSIAMYGRSISGLIAEGRDNNDDDCLLRAIKADRVALTCTTVTNRIARAELQNDEKFFARLSNALKGPSKKEWAGLAKMKFSFLVLRELELNELTDHELEQLMVHTLAAYQDVPGARHNLREQYLKFRALKTI